MKANSKLTNSSRFRKVNQSRILPQNVGDGKTMNWGKNRGQQLNSQDFSKQSSLKFKFCLHNWATFGYSWCKKETDSMKYLYTEPQAQEDFGWLFFLLMSYVNCHHFLRSYTFLYNIKEQSTVFQLGLVQMLNNDKQGQ